MRTRLLNKLLARCQGAASLWDVPTGQRRSAHLNERRLGCALVQQLDDAHVDLFWELWAGCSLSRWCSVLRRAHLTSCLSHLRASEGGSRSDRVKAIDDAPSELLADLFPARRGWRRDLSQATNVHGPRSCRSLSARSSATTTTMTTRPLGWFSPASDKRARAIAQWRELSFELASEQAALVDGASNMFFFASDARDPLVARSVS